jgi:hypothetical protein
MDAEIIAPLFYELLQAEVNATANPTDGDVEEKEANNGPGTPLPKVEALWVVMRERGSKGECDRVDVQQPVLSI